ncbi:unnamed protein product [Phytophthora fragariaefolia]|uniref:Unnamed protein product n=1 Tax=Phytophthora fragariaefolia TaxID=1490495 RepID=A0A9W6Y910_9STRA|nr:unnamed protein product [Phytophthora fragariaefolia]
MLPAPRRYPAIRKKATTQASQSTTLLLKKASSCSSGATLEKLASLPENKFQVDTQVFRSMTRLRTILKDRFEYLHDQDVNPS